MPFRLRTGSATRLYIRAVATTHALIFVAFATLRPSDALQRTDAQRYVDIAALLHKGGSFRAEYPPLALSGMRVFGGSLHSMTLALLALNAVADLIIAVVLLRCWSRRASNWYLCVSLPVLGFLTGGFDLVVAAVVVSGIAAARRHRDIASASILAMAVFIKIWPVGIAMAIWGVGRRKLALAYAGFVAAGVGIWVMTQRLSAPVDVVTFRGARGWNVESVPGLLLAVISGEPSRYEQGSWRVGAPPRIASLLITGALVMCLGLIARGVARTRNKEVALARGLLASVAAMMIFSTLLSPQYIAWLLPFIAIVCAQELSADVRATRKAAVAVVASTTVYVLGGDFTQPDGLVMHLKLGARNAALVWLLVVTMRALLRAPRPLDLSDHVGELSATDVDGDTVDSAVVRERSGIVAHGGAVVVTTTHAFTRERESQH